MLHKGGFNIDEKNANGGQEQKKFEYSVAGKKRSWNDALHSPR